MAIAEVTAVSGEFGLVCSDGYDLTLGYESVSGCGDNRRWSWLMALVVPVRSHLSQKGKASGWCFQPYSEQVVKVSSGLSDWKLVVVVWSLLGRMGFSLGAPAMEEEASSCWGSGFTGSFGWTRG